MSHDDVISSKPVEELLSLPEDTVFKGRRFFGTMSYNLRAASNGSLEDLDEKGRRLVAMFPDGFSWIESFPAIGEKILEITILKMKH